MIETVTGPTVTVTSPTATVTGLTVTVTSPTVAVTGPTVTITSLTATVTGPTATVTSLTVAVVGPTVAITGPTVAITGPTVAITGPTATVGGLIARSSGLIAPMGPRSGPGAAILGREAPLPPLDRALPLGLVALLAPLAGCPGRTPPAGEPCDGGPKDLYCSVWLLACTLPPDGGPARCGPPGEFAACEKSLGCAAGLSCVGPFPGPPPNVVCLQGCARTADCRDPDDVCWATSFGEECLPNGCGPGSAADGGSLNGTAFFAPCDAEDAGDGRCVPYSSAGAIYGVCLASGATPDGGRCTTDRGAAGDGTLCAAGLGCAAPDGGGGICAPLCDPDAGSPCGAGQRCRPDLDPGFLSGLCWPP